VWARGPRPYTLLALVALPFRRRRCGASRASMRWAMPGNAIAVGAGSSRPQRNAMPGNAVHGVGAGSSRPQQNTMPAAPHGAAGMAAALPVGGGRAGEHQVRPYDARRGRAVRVSSCPTMHSTSQWRAVGVAVRIVGCATMPIMPPSLASQAFRSPRARNTMQSRA
jgi:hypothetical protein